MPMWDIPPVISKRNSVSEMLKREFTK